ncbi:MAG TPA: MauE/DoxX family redox-associated membrane protein [Polyangia bacterium]|nr:MauE/DoxX family redox-associated membrane protein [Polyangia bacterium]
MSRLLLAVLRLALAAVLIVAGVLKLRDPTAFATEIANYQLLPALAPYLAAALPATEVLVGMALLVFPSVWRRSAALAAAAQFAMFLLAVGSAYLRGINIECGCFGTGGGPITALTLLRNLLLMAAALAVLRWERTAPAGAPAT